MQTRQDYRPSKTSKHKGIGSIRVPRPVLLHSKTEGLEFLADRGDRRGSKEWNLVMDLSESVISVVRGRFFFPNVGTLYVQTNTK